MPVALYRGVVALIWALAIFDTIACRGLFWDGASFLVNLIDLRTFHDFYPARAHVGWVTQLPVLIAIQLGLTDTHLLAILQSAALFALPVGLYHLALARARHDLVMSAVVLAALALVYLPTSFFIVGEYNAAYAAVTSAMAIVLTGGRDHRRRDGWILLALSALCLRSYEATLYLGPLLAAAVAWWTQQVPREDLPTRMLGWIAALGFLGSALVAGGTVAVYWDHPHFVLVRAAVLDFWQNLQFIVPVAGLALVAVISLAIPAWLRTWVPFALILLVAAGLVCTLWFRQWIGPDSMVFPPSHYVARTGGGGLLWAMLAFMWINHVWRRHTPRLLLILREAAVGRRLVLALSALVLAAAIPDIVLTKLWMDYLGYFRSVVASHKGVVRVAELPHAEWPYRLFYQDWTTPALGALVRRAPTDAHILGPQAAEMMPFDSRCGTLPELKGFSWRL